MPPIGTSGVGLACNTEPIGGVTFRSILKSTIEASEAASIEDTRHKELLDLQTELRLHQAWVFTVLIDPILRTNPDVGKIYVLIKAKDNEPAMKRLKNEEIHGKNYHSFVLSKQVPVVGNFREAYIGIAPELAKEIAEEVDVIVNSAANTTFDERYDVALDINTVGPFRIMSFAQRFRRLKLFLQVSTGHGRDGHQLHARRDTGGNNQAKCHREHMEGSLPRLDGRKQIMSYFQDLAVRTNF
ncbi:hypothetical protein VPH35_077577 [Triticum aestivum]